MYLTEYHIHSELSFDGECPLIDLAESAVKAGIRELCVTDHCDTIDEFAKRVYDYDWAPVLKQFWAAREKMAGRLTMKLGLEYGMGHVDPAMSDRVLALPELDFVIGSVHNLSPELGGTDIYYMKFDTEKACRAVMDDYISSIEKISLTPYYDVLGHLLYPLRYMNGLVTLELWKEQISVIMKNAISTGRGIELNTNRGRTLEDWRPILHRYKELGGEIITVGSDAHEAICAGAGIAEAYEILREAGFRYVTVYEKRKPVMISI